MWDMAYLINIPEQTDRLKYAMNELKGVRITPTIMPGIKQGEVGCKLSHLNVMKNALKKNVSPLIIEDDVYIQNIYLEDDVKRFWNIVKHYDNLLNIVDKELNGWDMFFFYCDMRSVKYRIVLDDNKKFIKNIGNQTLSRQPIDEISSYHLLEGTTFCTHFYVINKKSLKKVIDTIENNKMEKAIDRVFINNNIYTSENDEKRLRCFCSSQVIVCQCIDFKSFIPENYSHTRNGNLNGIFRKK